MTNDEIIELLAAEMHSIWSAWMEWTLARGKKHMLGHSLLPVDVDRWKKMMRTPYDQLLPTEQDYSRKEAARILDLLGVWHEK